MYRLINSLFKNRKHHKKLQTKTWETEAPIFENRIKKYSRTIKYTKSIDVIVKNFDNIMQEFEYIMKFKPTGINIEFNNQVINDIQVIDTIRDKYIKDFINDRIEIELKKKDEVSQELLKESFLKRALNHALKAIEYLPNDVEARLRIVELEQELINYYRGEKI